MLCSSLVSLLYYSLG